MYYSYFHDLAEIPNLSTISSSAPCRVDFGGIWDAKAAALMGHYARPCTVNIALNMRATIELRSYRPGRVKITAQGFSEEESSLLDAPFDSPLGLLFAIAFYFGVTGVHIDVMTEFPARSGLGGSGAVAVATICAFAKALSKISASKGSAAMGVACFNRVGEFELSDGLKRRIIRLAHDIEDGLRISFSGLQDQAAAAYGGAHIWYWNYRSPDFNFSSQDLFGDNSFAELGEHLLVVYIGEAHDSTGINLRTVRSFLAGGVRSSWFDLNELTTAFAAALSNLQWGEAARIMREELRLRKHLTPDVLAPRAEAFVAAAEDCGCGARFTGAGAGGCLWAVGEVEGIRRLSDEWRRLSREMESARLLINTPDTKGLL